MWKSLIPLSTKNLKESANISRAYLGNMKPLLSYLRSLLNVISKVWLSLSTKGLVLHRMGIFPNPLNSSLFITLISGLLHLLGWLGKNWVLMTHFLRKILGSFKKKSKKLRKEFLIALLKCWCPNLHPINAKYAELNIRTTALTPRRNFTKNYSNRATAKLI